VASTLPLHAKAEGASVIREGDVLAGRFRIGVIPKGRGITSLVRAWDLQLDRPVAIFFPPTWKSEDELARLAQEARLSAQVTSEHMLRIFHVGTLDRGEPYSVMEFLTGSDLACWLARRGPLPIEQAVDFVLQACAAVAEAHSFGFVHRDIKPANLFAGDRPGLAPSLKVLHWNLSTSLGSTDDKPEPLDGDPQSPTIEPRGLVGTPLYMSPEQWHGHADERSDIWSFGVTLSELVTGRSPFEARTLLELHSEIVSGAPLPLRQRYPSLPPGLEATLLKCLVTDPARRYQDVGELAVALLDFAPEGAKPVVERICHVSARFP
jgi:serine/threonine protein kinase